MKKIVIINQKGGTGKTTTAAMIGAGLSKSGKKALLIDLDPQGSLAVWFNVKYKKNLFHLLVEGADIESCIYEIDEGLSIIPSNKTLAQAEIHLATEQNRETLLTNALDGLNGADYVILDCAPSLNLLNLNAMVYADYAFVPVAMDYFSLIGAREVIDNLKWIREKTGHELQIGMIIPTFFDKRDRKSHEVLKTLNKHFGDKVVEPIRKNVKLAEAAGAHKDIFSYAPNSYGAADYSRIIKKVIDG